MRHEQSLGPAYFENMYRQTPDPWGFDTRPYEKAKYDHTLSALAGRRYGKGFEVGCANGALTSRLAAVCGGLLAIDVSETALAAARTRCAGQPHVRLERMAFPNEIPDAAPFDLIVLSEVAYYWGAYDLSRAAQAILRSASAGGDLILVHWTGETDYPQTGDGAVETLRTALVYAFEVVKSDRRPEYRLDLWRRR